MSTACQTRSIKENISEQLDEIIAKHGECEDEERFDEDHMNKDKPIEEQEIFKEKIKKAVIEQIFSRIWPDIVKKVEPVFKELSKNQKVCDKTIVEPLTQKVHQVNCGGDSELVNKLNRLSIDSQTSLTTLRLKSGHNDTNVPIQRNLTTVFPVKSVVIECNFPTQSSLLTVRNTSGPQRSSAKLNQSIIKYPSPERHLSPIQNTDFKRTCIKSAGTKKKKHGFIDRRQDTKDRIKPLHDAKVGRVISQDESR